ncbi:MAG: ATP-binding protein [Ruminococcus flavefaciens]|nr:ATP-binding protein [Ruminococcus flavefaciens]
MTNVGIDVLFIWGMVIHMIWLIGLDKLGSVFFQKKESTAGQYICFWGLLTFIEIWLANSYMVKNIVQQTLLMLFFFLIFRGDCWEKAGFSSVLVAIWGFAWNGINAALSICNILFLDNKFMALDIISIMITVICIYLLFCKTKLAEGNFLRGSGKILLSVSCLLLFLIDLCGFGITQGIVMVSDGSGAEYWNTTYNEVLTHLEVLVLSSLCMIICLSLLFGMNRLIGYLTIDSLHKMEINRYKETLEQYRKQASVRHDLKNHFISLSALAEHEEWDKLKEYVSKIYNAGMTGEEDIETGNNVVNAIVNTKKQIAKQKNIKFDCNINISKPLMMDEYDLCIIWGNILDNAIKAADVSEERYIFVQTEIVKRNLIINMKNTMVSDMAQKHFGMNDWGTGLKNVNKIVQKENGIMDIETKGTIFDISIMLPVVDCYPSRI